MKLPQKISTSWLKTVPIRYEQSHYLNVDLKFNLVQGVVLETDPLEIESLDYLTSDYSKHLNGISPHKYPLWVALDQIQDPQNLGAIIRSCVYYGVNGIVVTDVKTAPLNSTVSKVSAGALEVANVYHPGNLSRFLKESGNQGWRVIGTDLSDKAINVTKNPNFIALDRPTILVLGSEGNGIRKGVLESCQETIKLSAYGNGDSIGSMNVSATTAILLHHITTMVKDNKS